MFKTARSIEMESEKIDQEAATDRLDQYGKKGIVRGAVRLVIQAIVLFVSAGTLHWSAAWVYIFLSACFQIFGSVILSRVNPEIINVRGRKPSEVPPFDKIILPVWMLSQLIGLVLAGLDAGRMHWSEVPLLLRAFGFLGVAGGSVLIIWSMAVNTHFETTVRIQNDRDHRVCSAGPYCFVRHPGYTGVILAGLGSPLLLGSWVALIPGAITLVLFTWRTIIEDRLLMDQLPGYSDFALKTRYRLAPGLW